MAEVLRLENYAATSTFDLLSNIRVIAGSTRFQTRQGRVIETYRLVKQVALKTDIPTAARALEDMLIQMTQWHEDTLKDDSVWIRRAADQETAKRALVYGFEFQQVDNEIRDTLMSFNPAAMYELAITRHASYEPISSVNASSLTDADYIGGMWDISGTLSGGAIAGRLGAMRFRVQQDIYRMWAGIRELRGGSANFVPIIELEDGSFNSGTTSSVDATASPGSGTSKITTDFDSGAGASMVYRVNMGFDPLWATDAECEDQVGRYNVILRAKITVAGTQCGVKMVYGFVASIFDTDAPQVHYPIQHVAPSHTNWGLYSLGTIDIPSGGLRRQAIDNLTIGHIVRNHQLRIFAERSGGTGDLDMDCLILIPADHAIYIDGMAASITTDDDVWVFTHEDDTLSCYIEQAAGGDVVDFPAISSIGVNPWGYPAEGGILVVAAERKGNSNWGDTFDEFHIDDLYKRYLIYNA